MTSTRDSLVGALSVGGMAMSFATFFIFMRGGRGGNYAVPLWCVLSFGVFAFIGLFWLVRTHCQFTISQLLSALLFYAAALTGFYALEKPNEVELLCAIGANSLLALLGLYMGAKYSSIVPAGDSRRRKMMFTGGLVTPYLALLTMLTGGLAIKGVRGAPLPPLLVVACIVIGLSSAALALHLWQLYLPHAVEKQRALEFEHSSLGMLRRRKLAAKPK